MNDRHALLLADDATRKIMKRTRLLSCQGRHTSLQASLTNYATQLKIAASANPSRALHSCLSELPPLLEPSSRHVNHVT